MFATVECRDAPGGFKGFVLDLFTLPEIELQRIKVPFGEGFYRVIVTEYRGQIPVEETVEKLKRLKQAVVFETNFPCDERTVELEFTPDEFTAQLLFNSAIDYVKELKLNALKSSLAIFDPKGYYIEKIQRAVALFSKIQVFTKETASYEKKGKELMEKYGLSLQVSSKLTGKAPESTVIICPDEVPFCDFFRGIIFTNAEEVPPCACCIRGDGIELPREYELLRPGGIGRMHFAAALFEKGEVKKLGELSFKKMRLT